MWISADFERWHPGIVSAVFAALSLYAVEPSASMFDELLLVLPAQRPASPEIAESPTLTTHGDPAPGPSAAAGVAGRGGRAPPPLRTAPTGGGPPPIPPPGAPP